MENHPGGIPTSGEGVNKTQKGDSSENPGKGGHVPVGVGPNGPQTVTPSDPDANAKPVKA